MKSITVKDKTKDRFDWALASEIGLKEKRISADEFLGTLIDTWEEFYWKARIAKNQKIKEKQMKVETD